MQHRSTLLLLLILYILFFCSTLFAQKSAPGNTEILSARTAAIGGLHAALADDLSTLFNNPAGFRSAGPQFSATEFTLGIYGQAADVADEIISGMGSGLIECPYSALSLLGPVAFGYVGNGFGFGIFNTSTISFWTTGVVPSAFTIIEENFLLSGGYAFRIPIPNKWNSTIDLGFLLRTFIRMQSGINKDIQEVFGSFSDPLGLIIDEPFQLVMGAGIDLGVLYTYNKIFSIGLVGRNLAPFQISNYSSFQNFLDGEAPTKSSWVVPLDLSLGIFWRPPLGRLGRYISDLRLMLDYNDMIDFLTNPDYPTNPLLHIGLGCELQLLDIVYLRAGFYQCLPSAGLGLDLSLFKLNMAIFGRELSAEPGGNPIYNYIIGLEFRF